MNKIALALASAVTLTLSAGAVYAQAPVKTDKIADITRADAQRNASEMFAKLDLNKDGKFDTADRELFKTQQAQRQTERQAERFAQLDTDKNGSLSRAEFDAGLDHAREQIADRRGGGQHDGKGGPGKHPGARLDGDKPMTQAEFTAAALARFDSIDTNRDGTVTAAERQAQRAERRTAAPAKAQS